MSKVRPVPLAAVIADHIQSMILEGVLRPGEKLVAERDLAETLGVSRPSLHQALTLLEEKGLLVTTKSGTMVARFLRPLIEPLAELFGSDDRVTTAYFEFRQSLEATAARFAAERATPPDREAIEDCIARMRAAHAAGEAALEADCDAELHGLIYDAAHNLVLLHIMRGLGDLLRRDVFYNRAALYQHPGARERLFAQHQAIAEAVLRGDPPAAADAATEHMNFTAATIERIREDEARMAVALRRIERKYLVATNAPADVEPKSARSGQ